MSKDAQERFEPMCGTADNDCLQLLFVRNGVRHGMQQAATNLVVGLGDLLLWVFGLDKVLDLPQVVLVGLVQLVIVLQ